MARINLLPWRQEERLRKNKEFNVVLAAAAVVALLATGLTYMFFNGQLEAQQQANTMIETENARLDKVNEEISALEQQREEMIARMKLIQDLQGKRSIPVRVWDDIARSIPAAMYLVEMKRVDNTITIKGFADNANVVSQLVRNLDASAWLADSRIPSIQSKVQAYQGISRPKDKNGVERAPYPEDNYIGFTVTTVVKAEEVKTADSNVPVDPNAAAVAPTDPNAVSATPADSNTTAQPVSDATTNQAVATQAGDEMQPVPVAPATQPAAPQQPSAQPAVAPVPAAQSEPVAPVAPAQSEPVAPVAPAPQPAPAGGQ